MAIENYGWFTPFGPQVSGTDSQQGVQALPHKKQPMAEIAFIDLQRLLSASH
jgi:hypothetical protein